MGLPRLSEDCNFSRSWFEQSFENLNGGSFPSAIRPQQAETFSRLNFQIQPADGLNLAIVGFSQITALDHYRHERILLDIKIHRVCPDAFFDFAQDPGGARSAPILAELYTGDSLGREKNFSTRGPTAVKPNRNRE